MEITGYKYNTEIEAKEAINALNTYWKLPKPSGQSEFEISMFNTYGGGYWVSENKDWYEPALGKPYEFEIPEPKL